MAQSRSRIFSRLMLAFAALGIFGLAAGANAAPDTSRAALLGRHVPDAAATAKLVGRVEAARPISLSLALPLRNQAALGDLLTRLYDPNDPLFHRFLSVQDFTERFGPSVSDVNAVAQYAKSQGLTITEIAANHMIVKVTGPSSAVESMLGVHFNDYQRADGTRFRAPDREPALPRGIAARVLDVFGTDDLPRFHPFIHAVKPSPEAALADAGLMQPNVIGNGHGGALSPNDTRQLYNMNGLAYTGAGQTLALFELDGYTATDISQYESYYGISSVSLQNVLIDQVSGTPGDGASEVTLDIDMFLITAPGAAKIIVYEAPNTTQGTIDCYNQITTDNTASVCSTSWGEDEGSAQQAGMEVTSENQVFQEMAAQGQSNFAAAGDAGAYDNGTSQSTPTLSVDDPGSQPYMCDVGGTDLTATTSLTYSSESAWGDTHDHAYDSIGTGGGGGISSIWPIPSYQSGIAAAAGSHVSTTVRNVPDVSFFGDFDTGGYDVFFTDPSTPMAPGSWEGFNGTSAAAPLWAGFMARVNQARAANGQGRIGFSNPPIYAIAKNGAKYASDFHDVNDGTTNLYYSTTLGYDLATGWGSPKGATLLADLSGSSGTGSVTWSAGDVASASDGTARLLWRRSDGAAGVWVLNAANTRTATGPTYGPYSSGSASWFALGVAVASDQTSRLLWTRSDGAAGVWTLDASGNKTTVGPTYGPYTGWGAIDVAVRSGGTRVLWRRSDGAAGVWTMDAAGNQINVGPTYGPYSGWTATGVSAASDGTARILWTRNDGAAGLWTLNGNNTETTTGPAYGPYSGWRAVDVGTADNGSSTVLWTNTNGSAGLWTFNAADVETIMGTVYGPYSGFVAGSADDAQTGTTRILWIRSDRAAGLWSMNASDTQSVVGTTYGPF